VLWHGNRESWMRTLFSHESVVWWAITTHNRRTREFGALKASEEFPQLHWYEFRHPAEIERFLAAGG
jgi:hypothetical protein